MKNILHKIGSIAVWAVIAAYFVWFFKHNGIEVRDRQFSGIDVTVTDSASQGVITPGMVKNWIFQSGLVHENLAAREVPLDSIEKLVSSRGYVRSAEVYSDYRGTTRIKISQRHPMMRISTTSGDDFFITSDRYVLPPQHHFAIRLPIVTGDYTPPFAKGYVGPLLTMEEAKKKNLYNSYLFLYKLINFVEYIGGDDFWSAQILQINIVQRGGSEARFDPLVELIPRAGDHVISLGALDDYQSKLGKLHAFYHKVLPYKGWDSYSHIDLSYKNQIVCSK